MRLTDSEQAMLDGREGKAKQKAMDLLVRYAEALGAERFVDTTNVAGVPAYYSPVLLNYYKVTADDVQRVAKTYLVPEHLTVAYTFVQEGGAK